MEQVTTFVEKRRGKFSHAETTVTVKRKPTSLSEHRMLRHRWFQYAVDHIIECYEVEVSTVTGTYSHSEKFFEFVTPHGRGCVLMYQTSSEINVFIPNDGSPALLHGFWKKHGRYVGHAGLYAMANKVNPDSKKAQHTCPAVIYAALAGKRYGA